MTSHPRSLFLLPALVYPSECSKIYHALFALRRAKVRDEVNNGHYYYTYMQKNSEQSHTKNDRKATVPCKRWPFHGCTHAGFHELAECVCRLILHCAEPAEYRASLTHVYVEVRGKILSPPISPSSTRSIANRTEAKVLDHKGGEGMAPCIRSTT